MSTTNTNDSSNDDSSSDSNGNRDGNTSDGNGNTSDGNGNTSSNSNSNLNKSDQNRAPADPFDPASLRLTGDSEMNPNIEKRRLTVPVRKPSPQAWFQVCPDVEYQLLTHCIELKEERELYLVSPELREELVSEPSFAVKLLYTAVDTRGIVFLWPLRVPGEDGKIDEWGRSALKAAQIATTKWVRLTANMALGAYDVRETKLAIQPAFPKESMRDLLAIAFGDRFIDRLDHPVLRALRGEV